MPAADLEQPPAPRRDPRDCSSSRRAVARRPGSSLEVGVVLHVAVEVEQRGAGRQRGLDDRAAARGRRRGRRARPARGRSAPSPPRSAAGPPRPRSAGQLTAADAASPGHGRAASRCRAVHSPPCRGLGSPSSFPPTTRRRGSARRSRPCATGSRGSAAPWELIVVDNASTDGTAGGSQPLLGGRAHPRAAQRRQPRQGLLGAPRDAGGERRAAPALRRRLRALARVAAALLAAIERAPTSSSAPASRRARGVGRRQPLRRRIVGRTFVALCRPCCASPPATCSAASSSGAPTAVAASTRARARRLDVRRRGAGARPRARLPAARGRHRVERPRGLAPVDARVLVPVVRELAAARAPRPREAARAAPGVGRGRGRR